MASWLASQLKAAEDLLEAVDRTVSTAAAAQGHDSAGVVAPVSPCTPRKVQLADALPDHRAHVHNTQGLNRTLVERQLRACWHCRDCSLCWVS